MIDKKPVNELLKNLRDSGRYRVFNDIIRERGDGSVEFAIPCANMSAFRLWLFAMVESAEVLAPAPVREQVMQWLEELAAGK